MTKFEAVIGLEIHAQLKTKTKLFCACPNSFGDEPNKNICPVCTGQPGVLPVINKKAIELAIKTALGFGSEIQKESIFARKNYFYPDLPKNYQISQYEKPLALGGYLEIGDPAKPKKIGLTRIHLEEDAGKLVHQGSAAIAGASGSLVDFNLTGVPLLEIVSEPEITSAEEAKEYVENLRETLIYLDVSEANLEEGNLRCDANVSVRPVGEKNLGVKTEVKNLNSLRALQKALEFEIDRQIEVIKNGQKITQETRHWDEKSGTTVALRSKEESHDYRYFPEPDLIPLKVSKDWIEEIKKELPELPDRKKKRFMAEFGLSLYDVEILVSDKNLAEFFEATVKIYNNPKKIANWISGEILSFINEKNESFLKIKISPAELASLVKMVETGKISGPVGKKILKQMLESGQALAEILKKGDQAQISDKQTLLPIIEKIIAANPQSVADYKAGKENALQFLVGGVMRQTEGRANAQKVLELLKNQLK